MQVIQGCTCLDTFHSCSFHHCLARCELTTTMMFEDASHPMIFVNFSGASRGSHWFPWFQCWDPTLDASIPQGAVGLAWSPSGICLMHPDAACDEKLGVIRRELTVFHSFSVCKADSQDSSRNGFSKSSGKWVCLAHRGDRIAPIFAVLSHDFGGLKHVTSFDFDNFSGLFWGWK